MLADSWKIRVGMAQPYRHTQIGYVIVVALLAGAAWIVRFGMTHPQLRTTLLPTACVLLLALFIFPTLSVSIDASEIRCWFGIGLVWRRIALGDVLEARVVRNPWYWGWGIRLTPRGWMWNVSGRDAVELDLRNGGHFRIGTDQASELYNALQVQLRQPVMVTKREPR